MSIDRETGNEELLSRLPEKFRSIMEEAMAASGKSSSELIKGNFATRADAKEGGTRVLYPGTLDLSRNGIAVADLPKFLIVEKDLVIDGDEFSALEDHPIQVDGNIIIKNFSKGVPLTPGQTMAENLAEQFESWDGTSLGGKVILS